mgnify:CR=1 FL=1
MTEVSPKRLPALLRGSMVIAVSMAVMNLATYGFTVIAARLLGPSEYGALAAVMGLLLVVVIGSLIGMSLPFVLYRLKLDPATASAPLVTSIADIAGVAVYLSFAAWYLAWFALTRSPTSCASLKPLGSITCTRVAGLSGCG